jgi:hypothetical protein
VDRAGAADQPGDMTTTFLRGPLYCAALLPLSVVSLGAALTGRARSAARWWLRLGGSSDQPRSGTLVVAGHAVVSFLLGATALVPFGLILAFIARGMFYGLVDQGPYDNSWGGPTRGGAWLVHFLVALPIAGAAVVLLAGIAALHGRLSTVLAGRRPAAWVLVVALVAPLPAVAFFIAWLHQI